MNDPKVLRGLTEELLRTIPLNHTEWVQQCDGVLRAIRMKLLGCGIPPADAKALARVLKMYERDRDYHVGQLSYEKMK